jgi:hypothetical protein
MNIDIVVSLLNNFKHNVTNEFHEVEIKYEFINSNSNLIMYEINIVYRDDKFRITHIVNPMNIEEIYEDAYFKIQYWDEYINPNLDKWIILKNEFNEGITYDGIINN